MEVQGQTCRGAGLFRHSGGSAEVLSAEAGGAKQVQRQRCSYRDAEVLMCRAGAKYMQRC